MPPRFLSGFLKALAVWAAFIAPLHAGALSFSNRYRSPRNPERPVRRETRLIVLHTTEAGAKSSLNKLSERGEAHYCIDEKGVAYRIVDRNREAFHAGRSMWCGREECDGHSIGIEVVGHHDKPVTLQQLDAIRELLAILKKEFRIDDAHVVCHSHVAYGAPNKWQKRNHRGRKRCGMLFAMPSIRRRLGLAAKPAFDADVRAGRLVVGDPYLAKVLYGNIDTMADKIGRNVAPESKGIFSTLFSKNPPEMASEPEKENYYERPAQPPQAKPRKPIVPANVVRPEPAAKPAPKQAAPARKPIVPTKIINPAQPAKPANKKAEPPRKPIVPTKIIKPPAEPATVKELEDRMKFRCVGTLGAKMSPYKLVGRNWNAATTYYDVKGKVVRGDKMDPKRVPVGARVFVRK